MKQTFRSGIAALLMAASSAFAANVSFTNSLGSDDEVHLYTFVLAASSQVTFRTWSYAGGTNAAGSSIPLGGFDPIVSVFSNSGALLGFNDDGAGVAPDPATGNSYDSLLELDLGPGSYIVSLSQYGSFATGPNLSNGFPGSGVTGFGGRTANFALDLLGVDQARDAGVLLLVPEPAGLALGVLGLCAVGLSRRRTADATAA